VAGSGVAGAGRSAADAAAVAAQLGRQPRGLRTIAHRCPCGLPDVVETAPRLPDGTPFPTLYYLTCPRATAAVSRLEAAGLMREMTARLAAEPGLARAYAAAHRDYLARRDATAREAGIAPLSPGTQSAGGMPDRVKCLHALAAHELAVPGANPLGRDTVRAAGKWWLAGPCVAVDLTQTQSRVPAPAREQARPGAPARQARPGAPAPEARPGAPAREQARPEAPEPGPARRGRAG
jgi:uncharacterized protein